jgi:hypothetical protein
VASRVEGDNEGHNISLHRLRATMRTISLHRCIFCHESMDMGKNPWEICSACTRIHICIHMPNICIRIRIHGQVLISVRVRVRIQKFVSTDYPCHSLGGRANVHGSLEVHMVVAGKVVVTFASKTSSVEVGDVRLPLVPFVVGAPYDLSLLLLGNNLLIVSNDAVTFIDYGGHASSLWVVDVVDIDFVLYEWHDILQIMLVVFVVVDPIILVE